MPLTADQIRQGYRDYLGRDPRPDEIALHAQGWSGGLEDWRRTVQESPEARGLHGDPFPGGLGSPFEFPGFEFPEMTEEEKALLRAQKQLADLGILDVKTRQEIENIFRQQFGGTEGWAKTLAARIQDWEARRKAAFDETLPLPGRMAREIAEARGGLLQSLARRGLDPSSTPGIQALAEFEQRARESVQAWRDQERILASNALAGSADLGRPSGGTNVANELAAIQQAYAQDRARSGAAGLANWQGNLGLYTVGLNQLFQAQQNALDRQLRAQGLEAQNMANWGRFAGNVIGAVPWGDIWRSLFGGGGGIAT
jgi:hypothetical protein